MCWVCIYSMILSQQILYPILYLYLMIVPTTVKDVRIREQLGVFALSENCVICAVCMEIRAYVEICLTLQSITFTVERCLILIYSDEG